MDKRKKSGRFLGKSDELEKIGPPGEVGELYNYITQLQTTCEELVSLQDTHVVVK